MSLTDWGKQVKKELIDKNVNQAWLIERVHEKTGLYIDKGYMFKILSGNRSPEKIINAINEILGI